MTYSVAIPQNVHAQACAHLIRNDGQEDLCFALWYPSLGSNRRSALIQKLILPLHGERCVHGNASFLSEYFERALQFVVSSNAGLAFIHSHLSPGCQGMSGDDINAEQGHAAAAFGITGLPLVGLTIGCDGAWSARFWERIANRNYQKRWCSSVRIVGQQLIVTYNDCLIAPPAMREELSRTISAWGQKAQAHLARLRVGIVGTGSVGSIIAEALARMGLSHISLIDFDSVERINLDRILHATVEDAELCRAKVQVLAEAIRRSATADPFTVDALEYSIIEEEGYKAALDCNVLFSCVDRPWPRSVLNFIAYAHLIPIVDGGLKIESKKDGSGLRRADWRAHIATIDRPCLECIGQYDAGLVSAERDGYLDDPRYIEEFPDDQTIKRNENVFGFSLSVASFEILQFLAMIIAPLGQSNPGTQNYHFITATLDSDWNKKCNPKCAFLQLVARGDRAGISITGEHKVAEMKREERKQFKEMHKASTDQDDGIWKRIKTKCIRAVQRWLS